MSKIIAAAIAAAFVGQAQAITTYTFSVDGTLTHFFGTEECPPIGGCTSPSTTSPWVALLVVEAPDGDGAFDSFTIRIDDERLLPRPFVGGGAGAFAPALVVTVAGGAMSFDGHAVDGPGQYGFQGMAMSYLLPHQAHSGQTFGTAHLTTTPVPEPSTWALLLAGLVAAGTMQRRRA